MEWNGIRPAINWVLRDFRRYLIQKKFDKAIDERQRSRYSPNRKEVSATRYWIEKLLNTPMHDYRKNALRGIVAPYLINIRKLSYEEASTLAKQWLDLCSKKRPLDFNPDIKIRDCLKAAARIGYLLIASSTLKEENSELYNLVVS
jgi:non-catalytic primase subunit PriX-like protein